MTQPHFGAFLLPLQIANEAPMKRWWKSKTLWLNAISAGLMAIEASIGLIRDHFGAQSYLLLLGLLAAANAFLRFLTTQPVK